MRTNYQKGREFEYRTRKRLSEMGAVYIMRAASSKGAFDLIAIFTDKTWLVQCKTDGKLPKAEKELCAALALQTGHTAVMASKNKRGSLVFHEITKKGLTAIIQVVE